MPATSPDVDYLRRCYAARLIDVASIDVAAAAELMPARHAAYRARFTPAA